MAESIYELKADIFKALSHASRIQILESMRDNKRCACDLGPQLGIEQSNFSRHMAALKAAGLVRSWKEGVSVFFEVTDPGIFEILDSVGEILKRRIRAHQKIVTEVS